MKEATFSKEEIEQLLALLQSPDTNNVLLALQLMQGITQLPIALCSSLLGVYSYYLTFGDDSHTAITKIAKKLLLKHSHKSQRPYIQQVKTVFKKKELEAYFELLQESNFDLLVITELWYRLGEGVTGERFLYLYTKVVAALPPALRQAKARAYWAPRIKGSTAVFKPADGYLTADLMQWKTIDTLILEPYTAAFYLFYKHLQHITKIILLGVPHSYAQNTDIFLREGFETLQAIQQLEFRSINSLSKRAWQMIKPLANLRTLLVTLDEDPDYGRPYYQTRGFYCFTLVQLEVLEISGRDLNLNIPLHKLPNLKKISIQESTLEHATTFFQQLDALEYLEELYFHPALQQAYEHYQHSK